MIDVFVYGTLKRGRCLHHVLAGQRFLGTAQTFPDYVLVSLEDFPGMVLPNAFDIDVRGESIVGEVYRVDQACLLELDRVECVDQGMYRRESIALQQPPGITAETYFYNRPVTSQMICLANW